MKYFKKIDGERIYLSPVSIEDAELYTKWMNDEEICRNTNAVMRIMPLLKEREFLGRADHILAIVKKDEDRLLGNISFERVDYHNRNAEVGLFIGEEKDRHFGFGTEALELMLKYGFQELNFHAITLSVLSFNQKAISVYEKVGFYEVGRLKEVMYTNGKYFDRIIMEIREEEWREKNGI